MSEAFEWLGDRLEDVGDSFSDVVEKGFAIVDGILSDPKKLISVGIAIAFPGAAGALGAQLGLSGAAATIAGNTIIGTITNGGNVEEAVKSAVISAGAQGLTNTLKTEFVTEGISKTLTDIAAQTTANATVAALMGKDPTSALLFGGVKAASQLISDNFFESSPQKDAYDKLPDAVKNSITAAVTASLTGGDVVGATAKSLVDSAVRAMSSGVALQQSAIEKGLQPFEADEIAAFATAPRLTPQSADEFVDIYADAKAVSPDGDPAVFANMLFKELPGLGSTEYSQKYIDRKTIRALADAKQLDLYQQNPDGVQPSLNDIYSDVAKEYTAVAEGWEYSGQKEAYQALYGDNVTPKQVEYINNTYEATQDLTGEQSQRYREAVQSEWDPTKSDAENEKVIGSLLDTFKQENQAYLDGFASQGATVPGADDLQNILDGSSGTQLASTDNDAAMQAIDALQKPALLGLTPTAGEDRGAVESVSVGDDDALLGLSSAEVGQGELDAITGADTGTAPDDALLGLTPTEVGGRGAVESVSVGDDTLDALLGLSSAEVGQDEIDAINDDALLGLSSAEAGQGEVDAINDDALLNLSSAEVGQGEKDAIDYDALLGLSSAEVGQGEKDAIDAALNTGAVSTGGAKTTTGAGTTNTAPTTTPPAAKAADDSSGFNLLSLLALMGGEQKPVQQKPEVNDDPFVAFDFNRPFQVNPFAQNPPTPRMAEGGSIDELLELLQYRGQT
jgi:hypothetical protein